MQIINAIMNANKIGISKLDQKLIEDKIAYVKSKEYFTNQEKIEVYQRKKQ